MSHVNRGLPLSRSRTEQVFPTLTPAQIRHIAAHDGRMRAIQPGEVLVEQGESIIKQSRSSSRRQLQPNFETKKDYRMTKGRMEAFSDGVLAVIITIMVLEMKPPRGSDLMALQPVLPVFLSYVLSFVYVGIYWNNHHHLLHAAQHVTGGILWANLHLLFWLSLTPFATAWMGQNHFASWPVALYGVLLLFAGIAYLLLTKALIAHHGSDSTLAASIGSDRKGRASLVVYAAAIPLSFVKPWIACACYVLVAVIWLLPDPRIEKMLRKESPGSG